KPAGFFGPGCPAACATELITQPTSDWPYCVRQPFQPSTGAKLQKLSNGVNARFWCNCGRKCGNCGGNCEGRGGGSLLAQQNRGLDSTPAGRNAALSVGSGGRRVQRARCCGPACGKRGWPRRRCGSQSEKNPSAAG